MSPAASPRWCPTPEQLMILEEMYRAGVRTPNAAQIQQITAHLSYYGKIEGKNVFYWFQNHKARDRQKLKRKLSKQQLFHQPPTPQLTHHHPLLPYLHDSPPPPPPPPPPFPQLSHYGSYSFLPQGGVEDASKQMKSYTWQVDHCEMDKSMGRTYGRDWRMIMEVGSTTTTTTSCGNKPLKTLQLFPVTATGFKDNEASTSDQTA